MINQQSCGEVSSSHYTYAAPLKVLSSHQELIPHTIYTLTKYNVCTRQMYNNRDKNDSSLQTIVIITVQYAIGIYMIMAISGVSHHDLCNMHNYMCGNMAGCLCFTTFHTTRYGGDHFTSILDGLQGQCRA